MPAHEPAPPENEAAAASPQPAGPTSAAGLAHAPASVIALQQGAGNAAVANLLRASAPPAGAPPPATRPLAPATPNALARQPTPAAPTITPVAQVKHTYTVPDKKLGAAKELGYAQAQFKVGGVIDFEFTPRQPGASPEGPAGSAAGGGGPGGVTLKGAGGVNVGDGAKYQGEVTAEFDKRVGGILDGCTPKAKVGGEASTDKAKLGLEVSLEGQTFEPKFGFTIVDINKEDGIKFATLELAFDWKIKEFEFTAGDGTQIKITPKATPKIEIEPNYKRIATALMEGGVESAVSMAVEAALVAGPPLLAGIIIAQGIYMAGEKGQLHRNILEGATDARQAAMDYAQVMTGSEAVPQGPRSTAAVTRAKGELARIAAATKVSVEDLMSELRKNASKDFVRIHSQARQQVFSAYYAEVRKVIRAWRSEHYILALWTEEADDVNAASKLCEVVFSR